MQFSTILITLASVALATSASATVLIFDDFGIPSDPDANLNGRTPVTGPANWLGYSGSTNQGWKVYGGEALLGNAAGNGMAGIFMGANYFANNPAIYSLSANITMTNNTDTSWYAIGFNQTFPTNSGEGFYNSAPVEGEPWMFIRNNGELQVRDNDDNEIYIETGYDVSDLNLELVLDTTIAQWTVDAYVNGVQLDLNGGSAGNTYTYATNPANIASVGLSATTGVTGAVQTFTLQTIPEPHTYALILGSASMLGLLIYRRRR